MTTIYFKHKAPWGKECKPKAVDYLGGKATLECKKNDDWYVWKGVFDTAEQAEVYRNTQEKTADMSGYAFSGSSAEFFG